MAERTPKTLERLRRVADDGASISYADVEHWVERARLAVIAAYGEESDQMERLDAGQVLPGFLE